MNSVLPATIAVLLALSVSGCNHSSDPANLTTTTLAVPGASCANPEAATTRDEVITVNVPTDFDATANPAPTTRVPLTVYMPKRCPGERFPLILYGHGFSENRNSKNSELIDDGNMQPLLDRGYVAIKFDERGHGDNRPPKGGGNARLLDPNAEIQDARAILDWAYDHASEIGVQTQDGTGIAKDLKLGTLGGSYGGAFQMLLVALDGRVDVIAPDRTFHDPLYSVAPGDAIKSLGRLLCLFMQLDELIPGQGVTVTPVLNALANTVGPLAPTANLVRTRADLGPALGNPLAYPRPSSEQEIVDFLSTRGMDYFESHEAAGEPWGFGEARARLRKVPALFTQGQRDNLFNVTEAYWNARYFGATGADVRMITHEDGHVNPLAGQTRGPWSCGRINAQEAILAWFDHHLKGIDSAVFSSLPRVCVSVADTANAISAQPVGVELREYPVGSLSGAGAIPASAATLSASVTLLTDTGGVFVPVLTINRDDAVLAGAPRIDRVTVAPGSGSVQTAIALLGVGIRRNGQTFLVDEQVTSFVAGEHDHNRGVEHPGELLLPGVGERLRSGDEVGLLFFQHHVQFTPFLSGPNIGGITALAGFLPGGISLPPLLEALDPVTGMVDLPNPYEFSAVNVQLPILVPGQYPGSQLTMAQ